MKSRIWPHCHRTAPSFAWTCTDWLSGMQQQEIARLPELLLRVPLAGFSSDHNTPSKRSFEKKDRAALLFWRLFLRPSEASSHSTGAGEIDVDLAQTVGHRTGLAIGH